MLEKEDGMIMNWADWYGVLFHDNVKWLTFTWKSWVVGNLLIVVHFWCFSCLLGKNRLDVPDKNKTLHSVPDVIV